MFCGTFSRIKFLAFFRMERLIFEKFQFTLSGFRSTLITDENAGENSFLSLYMGLLNRVSFVLSTFLLAPSAGISWEQLGN